jgi:hypothetical protein
MSTTVSAELTANLTALELIAKRFLLTPAQIHVLPAVIERVAIVTNRPIDFICSVASKGGEFGEEITRICRVVA